MKRNFKVLMVLKFTAMFFIFGTALGFVTMGLWNWLVPVLFHGPVITFWQAIGLFILSKILLGGFKGKGGRHGGGPWGGRGGMRGEYMRKRFEERMSHMSEEEKEKFRKRCNFWENRGMEGMHRNTETTTEPKGE